MEIEGRYYYLVVYLQEMQIHLQETEEVTWEN